MTPYNYRSPQQGIQEFAGHVKPGMAFIVLIVCALIAFEIFNYSTTDHALKDMLGDLAFVGIPWSTVLALAFCGIDFAGIARLFTPEQGKDEPKEVWYLFGAWLLAATMNAMLTWWGVSLAVANHTIQNNSVIATGTMQTVIPVFVAILVWLIRILIIGTLSVALDRHVAASAPYVPVQRPMPAVQRTHPAPVAQPTPLRSAGAQPKSVSARPNGRLNAGYSQPAPTQEDFDFEMDLDPEPEPPSRVTRPEPSYHTFSVAARPANNPRPGMNNGDAGQPGVNGRSMPRGGRKI
jgi:hypothetical protein